MKRTAHKWNFCSTSESLTENIVSLFASIVRDRHLFSRYMVSSSRHFESLDQKLCNVHGSEMKFNVPTLDWGEVLRDEGRKHGDERELVRSLSLSLFVSPPRFLV